MSLFRFVVRPGSTFKTPTVVGQCATCGENITLHSDHAITECGHSYHRACILATIYTSPQQIARCVVCHDTVERADLGIPRPSADASEFGAAPVAGAMPDNQLHGYRMVELDPDLDPVDRYQQLQNATARLVRATPRETSYVVAQKTSGASLQNFTDRVRVPLYYEEYMKKDMAVTVWFGLNRMFQSWWYFATTSLTGGESTVTILPCVVSDLRSWWIGRAYTKKDFEASVIKTRELLSSVDAEPGVLERTIRWAPIIAVLGDDQRHETQSYYQDSYFDSSDTWIVKWGGLALLGVAVLLWMRKRR